MWATIGAGAALSSTTTCATTCSTRCAINWNGAFRSGNGFTPIDRRRRQRRRLLQRSRVHLLADHARPTPRSPSACASCSRTRAAATRDCLEKQIGRDRVAQQLPRAVELERVDLSVTLDRAKFRMPQRANVSVLAQQSARRGGPRASTAPDTSRAGDSPSRPISRCSTCAASTRRRGATRTRSISASARRARSSSCCAQPVVFTTSMRFDLGAMRERQTLAQQLGIGRTLPGTRYPEALFRSVGVNSVSNPMSVIIRQQDSLHLTSMQADSIAAMNRRYTYRSDSLWAPVARYFVTLPERVPRRRSVRSLSSSARRAQIDMLMKIVRRARDAAHARSSGASCRSSSSTRSIRAISCPIRDGTSLYVGGIAPLLRRIGLACGGMAMIEWRWRFATMRHTHESRFGARIAIGACALRRHSLRRASRLRATADDEPHRADRRSAGPPHRDGSRAVHRGARRHQQRARAERRTRARERRHAAPAAVDGYDAQDGRGRARLARRGREHVRHAPGHADPISRRLDRCSSIPRRTRVLVLDPAGAHRARAIGVARPGRRTSYHESRQLLRVAGDGCKGPSGLSHAGDVRRRRRSRRRRAFRISRREPDSAFIVAHGSRHAEARHARRRSRFRRVDYQIQADRPKGFFSIIVDDQSAADAPTSGR